MAQFCVLGPGETLVSNGMKHGSSQFLRIEGLFDSSTFVREISFPHTVVQWRNKVLGLCIWVIFDGQDFSQWILCRKLSLTQLAIELISSKASIIKMNVEKT